MLRKLEVHELEDVMGGVCTESGWQNILRGPDGKPLATTNVVLVPGSQNISLDPREWLGFGNHSS